MFREVAPGGCPYDGSTKEDVEPPVLCALRFLMSMGAPFVCNAAIAATCCGSAVVAGAQERSWKG